MRLLHVVVLKLFGVVCSSRFSASSEAWAGEELSFYDTELSKNQDMKQSNLQPILEKRFMFLRIDKCIDGLPGDTRLFQPLQSRERKEMFAQDRPRLLERGNEKTHAS